MCFIGKGCSRQEYRNGHNHNISAKSHACGHIITSKNLQYTYEGRSENSRPEAEMSLYDHNSAILFKKEPSVGALQSFRFARFIALLW
jgi:hypothetical protein